MASRARVRSKLSQKLLLYARKKELFHPGERIGVAVSGGADSVALLLLLAELKQEFGIVLSVVHFNHRLRGKHSDKDEAFVTRLAEKLGLTMHADRADVAGKARREKANIEDAARRSRYSFFERLVDEDAVDHVATAHTMDDQAETVLAHVLRGTGIAGLAGIHPVTGSIVRPLLAQRRAELRSYLRLKKQTWCEDATNRDTARTRARIRYKLVPLLEKQFQPSVVEHLATLAELAQRDSAFLDALASIRCKSLAHGTTSQRSIRAADLLRPLAGTTFNTENTELAGTPLREAVSAWMVRRLVRQVKTGQGELAALHVEAVLELALYGQSGKSLQLPGAVEVRREGDDLVFSAKPPSSRRRSAQASPPRTYERKIELQGGEAAIRIPEVGCAFRLRVIDWPTKRGETNSIGAVLDRDRLQFPLLLRNWRPGDKLHQLGHQKAHKLKRLFQEKRISRWARDGWPVLTSGGVVVWAHRFPVAAGFAANKETREGILIAEETY